MRTLRSTAAPLALALAGGCQLVSGLDGLHAGSGGGASSSTTSSTSSGTGGSTGGSTSVSASSSTGSSSSSTGTMAGSSSSGSPCSSGTQQDCCGVDCGGGACTGGICRAYGVFPAGNEGATTNLVIDQGQLYWGSADAVRTGPAAGGLMSSLVPSGSGIQPTSVAVAASHVYWTDNIDKRVAWTQLPSPTSVQELPTTATTSATSTMIAVKAWLVWNDPAKATIFFASLPDGAATLIPATNTASSPFAADDEYVYWDDGTQLWRHPLANMANAAMPLGSSDHAKVLFASPGPAANGALFWARDVTSGSDIRRAGKDGAGASTLVASTSGRVASIIADQNRLYWTESDCLVTSSLATVHTTTLASPMDTQILLDTVTGCPQLAQDATAIYWAAGNGAIQRLVKPLP